LNLTKTVKNNPYSWNGTDFISIEKSCMKNYLKLFPFIVLLSMISSCSIVGGIFKAGMGVGIFMVLAVLVIIVWAISKARNK
jgi:hypothetical protein